MDSYPLRFEALYRRYLWGGRRLETVLGKQLDQGDDYAESWEVVDHGKDQSVVSAGPLKGKTLRELVTGHGPELLGRHAPLPQFPLLFKFLDAQKDLSVQVHPNDEQGAKLDPPDLGKTEAWVILDAEPDSKIYAGLNPGVTREDLARHAQDGTSDECLHQFHPSVGDCVFIQAGTVHAIGAGLVVAEIQQSSDTTFRLFDWNRVGKDGKSRELHVEQSLATIDFDRGPVSPQQPKSLPQPGASRLIECDKFILDRWELNEPIECGGDDRFHILATIEGQVQLDGDQEDRPLAKGCTALLPAWCGKTRMSPQGRAVVLDMMLP